ncbi:uncharacterized protein LOC110691150 isoform X2 [Chenopodium quinoa]|uniref:uncharacterized protein LOC110691150 isoform X2 n=1 Tax=Chenopodium quinoa TaxID=63459 RepID=UPI000B76EE9B|nr:uncharacterized protein LOC110691150 isoform X2 [Chenopodium quinoa]
MESSRQHLKRKFWDTPKPLFNPWRRVLRPCRPRHGIHFEKANQFGNLMNMLRTTCTWIVKQSVLLWWHLHLLFASHDAQRLFICSGTIVHSYGVDGEYFSTVLTSATLIRCPKKEDAIADDIKMHTCIAFELIYWTIIITAIRIKSDVRLQTAVIGNLDDYTECHVRFSHSPPFKLVPHRDATTSSELIKLCPGMAVIALGRYNDDPYHIMAAPGKLILKDCGLDCGELVMADSEITKNGIGGPLINYSGRHWTKLVPGSVYSFFTYQ